MVGKVLGYLDFSACSLLKQKKEPQIAYMADTLSLALGFLGRGFCPRGVQFAS